MTTYADFQPTRLFQPTVAISPDGSQVAYSDNEAGQFNLVVQPTDGGAPRRLTSYTDNAVRSVTWQPDGAALVYTADQQGDEFYQIYRIAARGGEPAALAGVRRERQGGDGPGRAAARPRRRRAPPGGRHRGHVLRRAVDAGQRDPVRGGGTQQHRPATVPGARGRRRPGRPDV